MSVFAVFGFGVIESALVGGGFLLVLAVLNRRSIGNIFTGASAQAGKLGRWAKNVDPLAVYQEEVDRGTEKIAQGRQFLAKAAGEVRSSTRRVHDLETEVAQLNYKIDTAQSAGDPNKTVEGYALDLGDADTKLAKEQAKLKHDTERFNNFSAQVLEGQNQVEEARKKSRELGLELEQSSREKEMNEFARGFDPNGFVGGNKLKEAEEALQRQIDENRGSADADNALNQRVVRENADKQLDRAARAKAILARRAEAKDKNA